MCRQWLVVEAVRDNGTFEHLRRRVLDLRVQGFRVRNYPKLMSVAREVGRSAHYVWATI
jgi:hypothetical protein